jgi:hypothetical protein
MSSRPEEPAAAEAPAAHVLVMGGPARLARPRWFLQRHQLFRFDVRGAPVLHCTRAPSRDDRWGAWDSMHVWHVLTQRAEF